MDKGKITAYFKLINTKKKTCPSNEKVVLNKQIVTNKQSENSQEKKLTNESDDDDCIIVEKEIQIINLDEEDVKNDTIKTENNLTSNSNKDDLCCNDVDDEIISSQEVDVIPEDKLDESLASLEDDIKIISNSQENGMENKKNRNSCFVSSPKKERKKRVIIKRDYVTRFMVKMVKNFMSDKKLHCLFTEDDFKLIESFHKLKSIGARVIFARMYWLTSKYKLASKIVEKYLHVNFKCRAVREMIKKLKSAKLLDDSEMNFETWCELQTRIELINKMKPVLRQIKYSSMSKGDIVDAVRKACKPKNDISKHFIKSGRRAPNTAVKQLIDKLCQNDDFIIIHSRSKSVFDRLHLLMYAGVNPQILREKRLNLLLLNVSRGLQNFPAADNKCDSVACIFPNREYFEQYVNACSEFDAILNRDKTFSDFMGCALECSERTTSMSENKCIAQYVPPVWHHHFSPYYPYYKVIEVCIPKMRAEEASCEVAIRILESMLTETKIRVHKKPMWYGELVTCLWKMRNYEKAACVLERALTDTAFSPEDKVSLCDKAQRLAKLKCAKLNVATRDRLLELSHQTYPDIPHIQIYGKMIESTGRNKRVQYRMFDQSSGSVMFSQVEDLAIHHYITKLGYAQGEHWENSIITSLFALAFWDIIYSDMAGKGIFVCPYQELPLDMFTSAFYDNRKDMIEERLENLKQSEMSGTIDAMKKTYDARNVGDYSLYNDKIPWELLSDVLMCLGSSGLHAILKRLSHNYYKTHSGFPDITVWNADTKKIKFVEVKSHNDKLSFKQIRWIQYMIECGVDTEVCFVSPNQTVINIDGKINKPSSSSVQEVDEKKEKKKQACVKSKAKAKKNATDLQDNELKNDMDDGVFEIDQSDENVKKRKNNRTTKNDKSKKLRLDENQVANEEVKSSKRNTRRKKENIVNTPIKTKSPALHVECSAQSNETPGEDGVYVKTPTKYSKGVGYFTSPTKSPIAGQSSRSPYKNLSPKQRVSLSLTRRRLTDFDK